MLQTQSTIKYIFYLTTLTKSHNLGVTHVTKPIHDQMQLIFNHPNPESDPEDDSCYKANSDIICQTTPQSDPEGDS